MILNYDYQPVIYSGFGFMYIYRYVTIHHICWLNPSFLVFLAIPNIISITIAWQSPRPAKSCPWRVVESSTRQVRSASMPSSLRVSQMSKNRVAYPAYAPKTQWLRCWDVDMLICSPIQSPQFFRGRLKNTAPFFNKPQLSSETWRSHFSLHHPAGLVCGLKRPVDFMELTRKLPRNTWVTLDPPNYSEIFIVFIVLYLSRFSESCDAMNIY